MMLDVIQQTVDSAIQNRVFPGCVIGIVRAEGMRAVRAFGTRRYDNDPVTEDTVYDLASVTKSIPVASLALELMAEGRFSLAHTVKMLLPELQHDYGATIEDLLRYRVRGPRLSELANRYATCEEIRTQVLETGFDAPPGDSAYTNLPAFVLGLIIERVTGETIPALAYHTFFEPLGMKHTSFFPTASDCAPSEIDARGEVCGLPHDESAYMFAQKRRAVGHAGLFSTADDLLTFLQALLVGAFPAIVDGAQRGLGWTVNESFFMGAHASPSAFGKTGFTGTSVLCDPEKGTGFVILSNRCYPKRPADVISPDSAINRFRRDIADIVLAKKE